MPAKKAASKKRKTTTSRKKSAKKTLAKKSAKKKTVSKKKVAARKSAKKKAPARKKVTKKKVSKKKAPAKKKVTKKKVSKKKAPAKKKAPSRKKAPSKKKAPAKKKAPSAKKPSAKKKVSRKAVSNKKVPLRKRVPAPQPSKRKLPTRSSAPRGDVLSGPIHGIAPYKPKRGEEYMSDAQLEHFRKILSAWKRELMFEVDRTVHHMQDEAANFPDPNDRATQESEFGLELRTRDRERKLLRKIDSALARIDEGTYGWCDETGEEIGLKRLEARPVATLCLEAQERRELAERQFRDRDDRYR